MIRTQVYLPEDIHRDLSSLAKQEKTTLSELVRKGAKMIVKEKEKDLHVWLQSITGKFKGGPRDASSKIDYYLYVKPYEKRKKRK